MPIIDGLSFEAAATLTCAALAAWHALSEVRLQWEIQEN